MRCFAWTLPLLVAVTCLHAQSLPLDTEPEIGITFPFTTGDAGIGVKYPLLINDTTIVPAEAILRVIYVPPRVEDDRLRAIRGSSQAEASWTRNNYLKPADRLTPEQIARQKLSRETVWSSVTNFQLALVNLGSDDLRVAFIVPKGTGTDFNFYDERIIFPEGLLLGEINHAVTVVAVEKTKPGAAAGIKAGDTITKVGDKPTPTLVAFLEAYQSTKSTAKTTLKTSFPMTVKGADGAERAIALKLPPTITTGFLDSPINIDPVPAGTTKTNVPPLVPEVWEERKPTSTPKQ